MLGEINCVKEWWPNQKNNNPENKNKKQRQQIYSFAPVFDLILNAWRREKQGRYDDAVARLYRALELFGQINLLRWNEPLNSSDLDLDKLPKKISEKYAINIDRISGKVTLALIQNYILLQELETPVGRLFNKHKEKLRAVLNIRNNSLMAHGITPVSTQDCQKTKQALNNFIRESLNALDTKMPDLQYLQFPADLLQANSLVWLII